MLARTTQCAVAVVLVSACDPAPPAPQGLLGAWTIDEITFVSGADTTVLQSPQPGQAIFTESHYSLVWIPVASGMRTFAEQWFPTDDEKIRRYGEIVVNAGAYAFQGQDTIVLRPEVSRVPEFMGGGYMVAEYRVVADTLWYKQIDEYSFEGVRAPWADGGGGQTLRFVRAEPTGG